MIADQSEFSWLGATALMVVVSALLVGSGWMVVEIARRAADGRIGPNRWAGTRTKATMSSDDAWQAAHQAGHDRTVQGGWAAIATGVLSIPIALAVGDSPDATVGAWGVAVGVGSLILTILVCLGAWQSQQAAKRFDDDPSE